MCSAPWSTWTIRAAAAGATNSLPIPWAFLTPRERKLRDGDRVFRHLLDVLLAFSQPGQIARMALILRRQKLVEARYGAEGFEFRGWALLMLNRLHVIFAEERFEAMAFLVTNAGQQAARAVHHRRPVRPGRGASGAHGSARRCWCGNAI